MNIVGAICWVLLCLLSFATDIDYVEHTLTHKIIIFSIQFAVFSTLLVTAIFLYKTSNQLFRKLAYFGNYCGLVGVAFYLLHIAYRQPSAFISDDLIAILVFCFTFTLPCFINIKALKQF